jgi:hypothetical protein
MIKTLWSTLMSFIYSPKFWFSKALTLISKLVDHETLNLIKIYLSSTFFTFKGVFYEQTEGTTMGSSLSLVVANIFMEHFESLALNNFHLKPKCWFQFVDDTFVIWPHGHSNLISFFNHLNSLSPHIQFTMETQKDNSIPFLDVLIFVFLMAPFPTKSIGRRLTLIDTFMPIPIQSKIVPKNLIEPLNSPPIPRT